MLTQVFGAFAAAVENFTAERLAVDFVRVTDSLQIVTTNAVFYIGKANRPFFSDDSVNAADFASVQLKNKAARLFRVNLKIQKSKSFRQNKDFCSFRYLLSSFRCFLDVIGN